MKSQRQTPLQAVDEVLRPRKTLAALLYSDIRGFTQLSKQGDEAVLSAILPAQKTATAIVDQLGGIPRLHGDLVFSYFDSDDPIENMRSALCASIRLQQATKTINGNGDNSQGLLRYSIVTFGSVIVGNIGGTESAREITAIGNAANLASRLDSLTKEAALLEPLSGRPLVLSSEACSVARAMFPDLEINTLSLRMYNLEIRDFPEEKTIHLLPLSKKNLALIETQPAEAARRLIESQYSNVTEIKFNKPDAKHRNAA